MILLLECLCRLLSQLALNNLNNPEKAVVRRLMPIKTNPYPDTFALFLGDVVSASISMKICVNLRNLRIELRFQDNAFAFSGTQERFPGCGFDELFARIKRGGCGTQFHMLIGRI